MRKGIFSNRRPFESASRHFIRSIGVSGNTSAFQTDIAGSNPVCSSMILFLQERGWCSVANKRNRPDKDGTHRLAFDRNKKKIYATQTCCGICGKPVDFSQRYPHPLSPCIDHIIPVAKGGHPSDIDNLQLAHWTCNRQKSDKLIRPHSKAEGEQTISNRVLPLACDWMAYRSC